MKAVDLRLKNKLNEVFDIEPNNLGIDLLTVLYKISTERLKNLPFIVVIPLAFAFALIAYLIFGPFLVRLVTLLQYGF